MLNPKTIGDYFTKLGEVLDKTDLKSKPVKSPWFSLNHISHLATVEIRVVRLGYFQNLYLSFAIVEITHGVTANRDDTDFHHAKPQILYK